MRQLIRTPGPYWPAFLKGFLGSIGVFVWPAFLIFEAPRGSSAYVIGLTLLILFAGSTVVGVAFLIHRILSAQAYHRALEDGKAKFVRGIPW
jgi:hypothetical protein